MSANKRTEIFLPKIDGSTATLAHLLQHLAATRAHAVLLGPESGMHEYARVALFGTVGVPLRVFISPAFLRALRSFAPHVIHLVDPILLRMQAHIALQILFPSTSIVTSHHMNLPTYAEIFEYPCSHYRTWQIHAYLHSFARVRARYIFVPSPSTARLLRENRWCILRVVGRGVDGGGVFVHPPLPALHASWGAASSLGGPPQPEEDLGVGGGVATRVRTKLIGDGPYLSTLQRLCAARCWSLMEDDKECDCERWRSSGGFYAGDTRGVWTAKSDLGHITGWVRVVSSEELRRDA
ncbi:hypothetical protein B0H13DRAFT_2510720 [Mycena leptocephala]|nr:hypothetical protein B0H13DRAFT_2510720 [Mycena leptocephala]